MSAVPLINVCRYDCNKVLRAGFFLVIQTGSGATKKYMTTKWQALPSIINT